jgi:hypothetical protein
MVETENHHRLSKRDLNDNRSRDYGFMLYLDRQDFFLMHVHVCVCACVSVRFSRVTFSSDLD